MASQDPTKPKPGTEDTVTAPASEVIHTDITGETHVVPEGVEDPASVRVYVVQEGDSLATVAEKVYGDRNQWLRIRNANRDRIAEHDRLDIGSELRIPVD